MTVSYMEKYMKRYGDYAFGTITFLVVWFTVVKPDADSKRLAEVERTKQIEAFERILNRQRERDTNNESGNSLKGKRSEYVDD